MMSRKQYLVALVVLAVSGLVGGALSTWLLPGKAAWAQEVASVAKEIRAEGFVLVDVEGTPRARFAMSSTEFAQEPALVLYDTEGTERAALEMAGDQPMLLLSDRAGRARAVVDAFGPFGAAFKLFDEAGNVRAALASDGIQGGVSALRLYDAQGIALNVIGFSDDGAPGVWLADETGQARGGLLLRYDEPVLWSMDKAGEMRVIFGLGPQPRMTLYSEAGATQAALCMDGDEPSLRFWNAIGGEWARLAFGGVHPGLSLHDGDGHVRWQAP